MGCANSNEMNVMSWITELKQVDSGGDVDTIIFQCFIVSSYCSLIKIAVDKITFYHHPLIWSELRFRTKVWLSPASSRQCGAQWSPSTPAQLWVVHGSLNSMLYDFTPLT